MAVLRQKTKAKKAEMEARAAAAEARRAAQESVSAIRDLAQALSTQLKDLGLDERAGEAVERLRSSEAYERAQARAAETSKMVQAKAGEASKRAQAQAGDVSKRIAETDAVTVGREATSRSTAKALAGLGAWLATGGRGQRLGITSSKKRRTGGWLWALLGIGVGYGIGILTAPKRGSEVREQIVHRGETAGTVAEHLTERRPDGAPPFERPLADKVRTRLGEDPRTADLPSLNINVVNGTVVVRGPLPDEVDESTVRDVIAEVEGVDEVDMELGSTA